VTEVLRVDPVNPDKELIARAAECLRAGGLVAFPTETVYGLGAHALDRVAILRVFAAKARPANDPLIVHVATLDEAVPLVEDLPRGIETESASRRADSAPVQEPANAPRPIPVRNSDPFGGLIRLS